MEIFGKSNQTGLNDMEFKDWTDSFFCLILIPQFIFTSSSSYYVILDEVLSLKN